MDSMYRNLSDPQSLDDLLAIHWKHRLTLLRGLEMGSKRPFLSIQLLSDKDWNDRILVVLVLNGSDRSASFLYHGTGGMVSLENQSIAISKLDGILSDDRVSLDGHWEDSIRWVTFEGALRCKLFRRGTIIINIAFGAAAVVYVVVMQYLLRKTG